MRDEFRSYWPREPAHSTAALLNAFLTRGIAALFAVILLLVSLAPLAVASLAPEEVIRPPTAWISTGAPVAVLNTAVSIPWSMKAVLIAGALAAATLLTVLVLRHRPAAGPPTRLLSLYPLRMGDDGPNYSERLGRPPNRNRYMLTSLLGLGGHRARDQSRGRSSLTDTC